MASREGWGVTFENKRKQKPYRARISYNGVIDLGRFQSREEACFAYDQAVRTISGEGAEPFKPTNFPLPGTWLADVDRRVREHLQAIDGSSSSAHTTAITTTAAGSPADSVAEGCCPGHGQGSLAVALPPAMLWAPLPQPQCPSNSATAAPDDIAWGQQQPPFMHTEQLSDSAGRTQPPPATTTPACCDTTLQSSFSLSSLTSADVGELLSGSTEADADADLVQLLLGAGGDDTGVLPTHDMPQQQQQQLLASGPGSSGGGGAAAAAVSNSTMGGTQAAWQQRALGVFSGAGSGGTCQTHTGSTAAGHFAATHGLMAGGQLAAEAPPAGALPQPGVVASSCYLDHQQQQHQQHQQLVLLTAGDAVVFVDVTVSQLLQLYTTLGSQQSGQHAGLAAVQWIAGVRSSCATPHNSTPAQTAVLHTCMSLVSLASQPGSAAGPGGAVAGGVSVCGPFNSCFLVSVVEQLMEVLLSLRAVCAAHSPAELLSSDMLAGWRLLVQSHNSPVCGNAAAVLMIWL